jgi:hypothetical protein
MPLDLSIKHTNFAPLVAFVVHSPCSYIGCPGSVTLIGARIFFVDAHLPSAKHPASKHLGVFGDWPDCGLRAIALSIGQRGVNQIRSLFVITDT